MTARTLSRWRGKAGALVLAAAAVAVSAGPAAARPDAHEPNDDSSAAAELGLRAQGSVAGSSDADWYRISQYGGMGSVAVSASAESPDCDPPALRITFLNERRRPIDWAVLRPARGEAPGYSYTHQTTKAATYFVVVDARGAPGCERELDYRLETTVSSVMASSHYWTRECAFARQDVRQRQRQLRAAQAALRRAKTRRQRARGRRGLVAAERRLAAAKRVANRVCPGQ